MKNKILRFFSIVMALCIVLGSVPLNSLEGLDFKLPEWLKNPFGVTAKAANNSSACGENLEWQMDMQSGLLTISGTGAMTDFSECGAPWYNQRSSIQHVTISQNVTSIGNYAFSDCSSLTSITIPDSVRSIGDCAFSDCTNLESVKIPIFLEQIGHNAFYKVKSIECYRGSNGYDYCIDNNIEYTIATDANRMVTVAKSLSLNNHFYVRFDDIYTWEQARLICEALGGHLATMTSLAEKTLISSLAPRSASSSMYSLGAIETEVNGNVVWSWITGEKFIENDAYWDENQPNDEATIGNFLGYYTSTSSWNDISTNNKNGFICEFEEGYDPLLSVTYNGHIYQLCNQFLSWEDAKAKCELMGGHLVTITSEEENAVVKSLIDAGVYSDYSVGAQENGTEGEWKWVTNEPFDFVNCSWNGESPWNDGEPNNLDNSPQSVMQIHRVPNDERNGKWDDTKKDKAQGFICEIEPKDFTYAHRDYYEDNLYEVYDESVSWWTANEFAKQRGGHLVTITDEGEQGFISDNLLLGKKYKEGEEVGEAEEINPLSKNLYWLGLFSFNTSNEWKWVNGEGVSGYFHWSEDEPSNHGFENFAHILRVVPSGGVKNPGDWNDQTPAESGNNFYKLSNTGFIIEYENRSARVSYLNADKTEITHSDVHLDTYLKGIDIEGYTVEGYYTDEEFQTEWNMKADKIVDDTTLYVKRSPKEYIVTLNLNGGTCAASIMRVTFDSKYRNMPKPEKEGYVFAGWRDPNKNIMVNRDTIVSTADNHELDAKWIPKTVEITFNPEGGFCDKDKQTATFNSKYGVLPTASRSGYVFVGWINSSNEKITEESIVSIGEDHELRACWIERKATGIGEVTNPIKTEYVYGEEFNPEGMTVEIHYDNGETETVSGKSEFEFSKEPFTECGEEIEVEVTCQGQSFIVIVSVAHGKDDVESVEITKLPDKLTYSIGDRLDTTGLELMVTYINGDISIVSDGFECSSVSLTRNGEYNVKVTYLGKEKDFRVDVVASHSPLASISILSMPKKTVYGMGEEIDLSGLTLSAIYENGTTEEIKSGFISNYDFSTAGTKTVSISFTQGSVTASTYFTVTVTMPATITADSVSAAPNDTVRIPVRISNNPGIMGFSVNVSYDASALKPVSVSRAACLSGNLTDSIENSQGNSFNILWHDTKNMTENGEIIILEFEVCTAQSGDYGIELTYSKDDTFDEQLNGVALSCFGCTVSVMGDENTPSLSLQSVTSVAGGEFEIPVSIVNNSGFGIMKVCLSYDDRVLKPVAINSALSTVLVSDIDTAEDTLTVFLNATSSQVGDGVLFSVSFISEPKTDGEYTISMSNSEKLSCENGTVIISNPSVYEVTSVFADNCSAHRGDTVEVPVNIENNNGIMGFKLSFCFDPSVLEPVSITAGYALGQGLTENNIGTRNDKFDVIWTGASEFDADGELLKLTFAVKNSAQLGNTVVSVSYSPSDTFDEGYSDVEFKCSDISVNIHGLIIVGGKPTLFSGNTVQLRAVYSLFQDEAVVSWHSSNPEIVSVDENGFVTANGVGNARITAIDQNRNEAEYSIQVVNKVSVYIYNPDSWGYTQKINWWKKYSSATMQLRYTTSHCPNNVRFEWSSNNHRVKIDENGLITNSGSFARSANITLTVRDAKGNVLTKSSVRVCFYKFEWQQSRLQAQTVTKNAYGSNDKKQMQNYMATNDNEIVDFESIISILYFILEKAFDGLLLNIA